MTGYHILYKNQTKKLNSSNTIGVLIMTPRKFNQYFKKSFISENTLSTLDDADGDTAALAATLDTPEATMPALDGEIKALTVFGDQADVILALGEKYASKLTHSQEILKKLQDATYDGALNGKLVVDVSRVYDGINALITDLTIGMKARATKEASKKKAK